jgi:hypothetical protein
MKRTKERKKLSEILDLTHQFLLQFSKVSANNETKGNDLQGYLRRESLKISVPYVFISLQIHDM